MSVYKGTERAVKADSNLGMKMRLVRARISIVVLAGVRLAALGGEIVARFDMAEVNLYNI
jgi:hypothetical protein